MTAQRVLVYAWAGMGNLGDDWILGRCLELLPGAEVTLLLEPGAEVPPALAGRPVLRWPALAPSVGTWSAVRAFRRRSREHDLLLLAGGGFLAGDQGWRSPLRWLLRLRAAGLPVAGVGLGVGPFPSVRSRLLGRALLRRFGHVTVRTPRDGEELVRLTGRAAAVVGDVALTTPAPARGDGRGVVVSVPGPQPHWLGDRDPASWAPAVSAAAQALADGGEPVTFLLFDAADRATWEPHGAVCEVSRPEQALAQVAAARVVLAGRFHAAVAAAVAGVPAVGVGYHHKFDALAGLGLPVVTPEDLLAGATPAPAAAVLEPVDVRVARWRDALQQALA